MLGEIGLTTIGILPSGCAGPKSSGARLMPSRTVCPSPFITARQPKIPIGTGQEVSLAAGGIMHSFYGTAEEAMRFCRPWRQRVLTFKKSEAVQAAALVPAELSLETDAPYLAPVPSCGKQMNQPIPSRWWNVWLRYEHESGREELTTGNARRLFRWWPEGVGPRVKPCLKRS